MPQTLRFHLDESVTTDVAKGLHKRDRVCSTTQEVGLMGVSDPEQLAFAKKEDRVLITADQDFLRLVHGDHDHPGVIYWNTEKHFGQVINRIDEMCMTMAAEDFRGKVFYL